jgi:hypothetical protein
MFCSMESQKHTVLIVPPSLNDYCVLKFRLVAKGIISSKLPMASYCPEQTYLLNRDFTYGNDTPIRISNVLEVARHF